MLTDTTDLKVCYLHVGLWNVCVLNVFKTSNLGFAVLGPEEQLSRLVHLDEFIALPLVVAKFATKVMCACVFLVCSSLWCELELIVDLMWWLWLTTEPSHSGNAEIWQLRSHFINWLQVVFFCPIVFQWKNTMILILSTQYYWILHLTNVSCHVI